MYRLNALWLSLVWLFIPIAAFAQDVTGDDGGVLEKDLSNEALWAIIMGVVASIVTAVVNQRHWMSEVKLAVFTGVAMIGTFGTIWLRGDLDTDNWIRVLLVVFASGAGFYKLTAPAMTALEARTSRDPV